MLLAVRSVRKLPNAVHGVRTAGFSLIESVVVLAVIGLVVAGIWGAASSIALQNKTNSHASGLLQVVTAARRLLSTTPYPTTSGTLDYRTDVLYRAGVFPSDWKFSGYSVASGYGRWMEFYQANNGIYNTGTIANNYGVAVVYYRLKPDECVRLVMAVAGHLKDNTELAGVNVTGGVSLSTSSITLSSVQGMCQANQSDGSIDFTTFWFRP